MPKSKRSEKVYKRKQPSKKNEKQVKSSNVNVDPNNFMAMCMRCKKQMKMMDARQVTLKNGRNAMKGVCVVCGTTMFKFV